MAADASRSEGLLARLRAARQTRCVPFAGGQMAWHRFGAGAPLVLLHGGHGAWAHWARNIEALAARHTVWVPDLPGYGESDSPAQPTMDALLAATQSTLDALLGARTPVSLGGFSFGGLVAAHLAARRGRVAHLALLGPAGHGGARRPRGVLQPWRGLAPDSASWAEVMRHNLLMHMLHAPEAVDADALEIHGTACLRTRFHSKTLARAGGLADGLAGYAGPLTLVWGEHDVTAVPQQAAALAHGRPHASVHILPGAGHWVQYEASDAVNRLLLARMNATLDA